MKKLKNMKKYIMIMAVVSLSLVAFESNAQLMNTKLDVTVRNDLGNIVEGATVTLYKTESDYDFEENPVQSGLTDEKGRVQFKNLEPTSYFMHVTKGDLTNIGRGVRTAKLIAKKKNILNVVIE